MDAAGRVCIAYWAQLTWKTIAVSWSNVLFEGKSREHLFSIEPPQLNGNLLTWHAEPLQCEMTLRRRAPAYATTLFTSDDGTVSWRCEMPAADGEVRVGDDHFRGRGYAELLTMTLPPWELPIDELRWGRFGGDEVSLVWINWKGARPLDLLLINGTRVDRASNDLEITIEEDSVIRSAALSETLASMIPLVPKRLLTAQETKWRGRGTVRRRNTVVDRGWAVHELVKLG